jgi:N-acetylneuraminic acid mutarotase
MAVGVIDGIIYVVGGNNFRGFENAVQAYNPATNTWTTRASLPRPRTNLAAGVIDGRLYAVGGCFDNACNKPSGAVDAYNPVTNTWSAKTSMPTKRGLLGAAVVNGVLYAVGGAVPGGIVNTNEAFNPR